MISTIFITTSFRMMKKSTISFPCGIRPMSDPKATQNTIIPVETVLLLRRVLGYNVVDGKVMIVKECTDDNLPP